MKTLCLVALVVLSFASSANAAHRKGHPPTPSEAIVSIFGFKYVMIRPGCDLSGNGTARLDRCAKDGMAAATGDSRRKGRNR